MNRMHRTGCRCFAAITAACLAALGCSPSAKPVEPAPQEANEPNAGGSPFSFAKSSPSRAARVSDSFSPKAMHRRMLDELEVIQSETNINIQWLGDAAMLRQRERLAAVAGQRARSRPRAGVDGVGQAPASIGA